ncbi:MAG: GNAT family N-acetyltransferase [Candidatus Eisenbacteria bacterium]
MDHVDGANSPERGLRSYRIRFAVERDVPVVLRLIRDLAEYEKLAHEVISTEDDLRRTLFGPRPYAEVVLAESVVPESTAEFAAESAEVSTTAESAVASEVDSGSGPGVSPSVLGFALFFHNYSTFLGKPGLYLEDLFVRPECRGLGVGAGLLRHLARLAKERGCGRFEWSVLDWNQPAIDFYRRLGAERMENWRIFRVTGKALDELAGEP